MIVSVLKVHFRKLPPKVITYRNISNYDNANFINSLNDVLNEHENQEHLLNDPDCFYKVCAEILHRHAPQKKKNVRGNNKPFMNKTSYRTKDPTEHIALEKGKEGIFCQS